MNNKQIKDIHERIYQFVLRVLKLLNSLPKTPINLNIIDQCSQAVTSVGANDQEADACASKKDFLAK
jgi:four helix bundle protein